MTWDNEDELTSVDNEEGEDWVAPFSPAGVARGAASAFGYRRQSPFIPLPWATGPDSTPRTSGRSSIESRDFETEYEHADEAFEGSTFEAASEYAFPQSEAAFAGYDVAAEKETCTGSGWFSEAAAPEWSGFNEESPDEFSSGDSESLSDDEVPWISTSLEYEGPAVIGTMERLIWTPIVLTAIAEGNRDENKLANLVFHSRHPELQGRSIKKGETALAEEWKAIREVIVRPVLALANRAPVQSPTVPGATAAPTVPDLRPLAGKLDVVRKTLGDGKGDLQLKIGRVARPWFRLRSSESSTTNNEIRRLTLNEVVFVERELRRPGETLSWLYVYVAPPDSDPTAPAAGWIRSDGVALDPPEPGAQIHYVERDTETLIDIAGKYYKPTDGFKWGDDARFYVAALAYANRNRLGIIFPDGWTDADFQRRSGWKDIHIKKDHTLWIPSRDFMRTLGTKVSSGSITYELWQKVKKAAKYLWDWIVFAAAFIAGIIHGAMEAVYDLFADLVGLVELVWKVIKQVFTEGVIATAKKLWQMIKSIDDVVKQLAKDFGEKWNAEDAWDRGYFRGRVTGYIIAEILMAIFSFGATAALKLLGKAGKFARLVVNLAGRSDFVELATKLGKKLPDVPDAVKRRVNDHFTARRPAPDAPTTPKAPDTPTTPRTPDLPDPPELQRLGRRVPADQLQLLRLLPREQWNRIVAKARQVLTGYQAGGTRRAGAINSLKGVVHESFIVRLPIYRETMEWAREAARRAGFGPDTVRFSQEVTDRVVNPAYPDLPPGGLTDGLVYAQRGDEIIVLAVFEAKSGNFRALAKKRGSIQGQVESSLSRIETPGRMWIDGREIPGDKISSIRDHGDRVKWVGVVPRDLLSPVEFRNLLDDLRSQGRSASVVQGPLTDEANRRIAQELLADLAAHP